MQHLAGNKKMHVHVIRNDVYKTIMIYEIPRWYGYIEHYSETLIYQENQERNRVSKRNQSLLDVAICPDVRC